MDSTLISTLSSPRQASHGSATRSASLSSPRQVSHGSACGAHCATRSASLTGTKDTDKLILLELDDESFNAVCSANRYTHSLCDETLWAARFERKYGDTLWQYGVSHRDVYIAFSKLEGIHLEFQIIIRRFYNLVPHLLETDTEERIIRYFRWASLYKRFSLVTSLLSKGIDESTFNGALMLVTCHGVVESVQFLLDNAEGRDINVNRIFLYASKKGHVEIVKLLLDRGANIHDDNDVALRTSSHEGHVEVVRLLLDNGANIHTDNDYALRTSSQGGYIEVVKLLLDSSANIHADDDYALRTSSHEGHIEVVRLLLDRGASVHARNDYALRLASKKGHLDVVNLLLNNGADMLAIMTLTPFHSRH